MFAAWDWGFELGSGLRGEDFEVELLIDLAELAMDGEGEQLVAEGSEDAQIASRVLGEGGLDLRGQQVRIAGLGQGMLEPVEQLFGREVVERQADADAAGDGQQLVAAELLSEAGIAAEHDGENRARIELGGGEDAQLGEDRGRHLLGFVDEQDGTAAGGLDVGEPGFAEDLEAAQRLCGARARPKS
jgi:hypothetical protein